MTMAMRVVRKFELKSLYWTLEPMGEFVAWTNEELDYRREARYADRLRRNATTNAFERVPEVFWEFTTRRTLVVEFLTGVTVLDYLRAVNSGDEWSAHKLRTAGFEPNRFARHIIDNFLGDAFQSTGCSTPTCTRPTCWCCRATSSATWTSASPASSAAIRGATWWR